MIIKKFQAKTEDEAMEMAKKELGGNFVLMNVRNVKKKGFFGLFKPQQVEITVALEDENERAKTQNANARSITEALTKIAPIVEKAEEKGNEKPSGAANTVIEEKLESLQSLLEEKLQKPEEEKKEVFQEKNAEDVENPNAGLQKFYSLLLNKMLENEVDGEYARGIIDETVMTAKPGTPVDVLIAATYQKMILKFGMTSTITPAENGPKVVFFVGPTGVGKTTTIAKIASKFSVEQKKKIALLTADTYRIAAAEQLKTYANILEVPFMIIYTIEEMQMALRDFMNFDYIFVDTAGHSHQNSEQKNIMGDFIHSVDGMVEKEVFLVVSATTKYRDLKSISDAYSEITDYKLIFTKLDETTALGNLLNLKLYTDAPLSYVTCGQNVPDDIEDFNAQRTVKNLLGGKLS